MTPNDISALQLLLQSLARHVSRGRHPPHSLTVWRNRSRLAFQLHPTDARHEDGGIRLTLQSGILDVADELMAPAILRSLCDYLPQSIFRDVHIMQEMALSASYFHSCEHSPST